MPHPRVSVIISNRNCGAFAGRAILSALAQNGASAEMIVVDDGSDDDSRARLQVYRPLVRLIFQDHRGQAAAINAGVTASRGEILCFLDANDWWMPAKVSAMVAAFDADPRVVLAYHRLQPARADSEPVSKPVPRTLVSGDLTRRLTRSAGWWPFPMTSAIAVRRNAWNQAGDIPESLRIAADAWLVGVYPFLGRVAALPEPLGFHRIHASQWHRQTDDAAMLRRRMAHWATIVDVTNGFLAHRGAGGRLRLDDHFPYRVAAARLDGIDMIGRIRLALQGMAFAGEPNPLRRVRDMARTIPGLPAAPAPLHARDARE